MAFIDKDEILKTLSITQVLEHYGIKRGGGNNNWHCPFHDDKNPSMIAGDDKNIATCMSGCGSFDIFSFIQRKDNLDFKQALKKANEISGKSASNPSTGQNNHSPKKNGNPTLIPDLSPIENKHRKYLRDRGITNPDKIISHFQLKAHNDFLATPLTPNYDTYKFIRIDSLKKPSQFYKGKNKTAQLYRSKIAENINHLVVVAGEKDLWRVTDAFLSENKNGEQNHIEIVSNTSGEGNIPENFFESFADHDIQKITICYDHDKSGREGALKVAALADHIFHHASIALLHFPEEKDKGYDLTDFLNEGHSFSDIFALSRQNYAAIKKGIFEEKFQEDVITDGFLDDAEKPDEVIKTGLKQIDEEAPLILGENTIITGRTGSGKTLLAVNMTNGVLGANEHVNVVFFSVELKKKALFHRLIACAYDIEQWKIKRGFKDREGTLFASELENYRTQAKDYQNRYKNRLLIIDYLSKVEEIEAKIDELIEYSFFPHYIIIDYANILSFHKDYLNEHPAISKSFKFLAKRKNIHVQLVCQANRLTKENDDGFARTENLSDSDQYGRDAFTIYSVKSDDENTYAINPVKNRNGKANQIFEYEWNPKSGKIRIPEYSSDNIVRGSF